MRAIAHRAKETGLCHDVDMRDHRLVVDEPRDKGGEDSGPTPQELLAASLASCTAVTIEMYAARKQWDLGEVEVECDYEPASEGQATEFKLTLRLPGSLPPEQVERLEQIAAKCPVHKTLAGETRFQQQTELVEGQLG